MFTAYSVKCTPWNYLVRLLGFATAPWLVSAKVVPGHLLSTMGTRLQHLVKKSCIRVTLVPLVHVWFRSTDSVPWVHTMGVINTMSPCLCHESLSIPCVHAYTMRYLKVQRGTYMKKRYLKVTEVPKGPRDTYPRATKRSKRYLMVQDVP